MKHWHNLLNWAVIHHRRDAQLARDLIDQAEQAWKQRGWLRPNLEEISLYQSAMENTRRKINYPALKD